MTKAELIDSVVKGVKQESLTKKAAAEIIDTTFEVIKTAIRKDAKFAYPGFGTFVVRKRKARKGRNPRTGDEIEIKASKTVGFTPSKDLKGKLT